MTDYFARMRQLTGTSAEWAANDIVIGLGEFAIEIVGPLHNRLKLGDGFSRYSALPYYDPGINSFVELAGDTMTGPLEVPELDVTGPATFTGAVALGTAATAGEPPTLSDADTSVPTTHWVQQLVGGIISGLHLKGTWNATTNSPTLASGGAGTVPAVRGDFYIVSVSGTTALDGISTWNAGDSVVFNGVTWQRVPQTLNFEQIVGGLGYTPVNKAGDTMTGALTVTGGAITGRTEAAGTNDLKMASTAFVQAALTGSAQRLFAETVLAGAANEIRVNIPAGAKALELWFALLSVTNDTPVLQALNGATPIATSTYNTQYMTGSGTTATGSYISAAVGWQLGTGVNAAVGVARVNWMAPLSSQVIGTASLWCQSASLTKYSLHNALDGGPTTLPTGFRIYNFSGANFVIGSSLRCLAVY